MFVYGVDIPICSSLFLQRKIYFFVGEIEAQKNRIIFLQEEIKALESVKINFSREINLKNELFFHEKSLFKTVKPKNRAAVAVQQTLSKERGIKKIQQKEAKIKKNRTRIQKNIDKLKSKKQHIYAQLEYYKSYLSEFARPVQYSENYDFYASYSEDLGISDITSRKPNK